MSRRRVTGLAALLSLLLTAACSMSWSPSDPLPLRKIPAPTAPAKRLVIVLPGMGNTMQVMEESGIAAAIQRGMPDADVMLTLASIRYYFDGGMPRRVHDQVVMPARQRGYSEIWLAGASMGGGGVTMYEREYPGEMTGLILLAPYMGSASLLEEIQKAGGLTQWQPGPTPAKVTGFNIAREQWRTVQTWTREPARNRNVWLICGTKDSLLPASELIAQVLPPDHYLKNDGIHDWTAWITPATAVFTRIGAGGSDRE